MRLSKRLVELGLCSRREADACIEQGLVKVDGQVVRVLGSRVRPEQLIELTHLAVMDESAVSILYHALSGGGAQWGSRLQAQSRWSGDTVSLAFMQRHTRKLLAFGARDPAVSGLVALTQDKLLLKTLAQCEMEFLLAVDPAPAISLLKQVAWPGKISRQGDRQLRLVMRQPAAGQFDQLAMVLGCPLQAIRCIRIGRLALGKLPEGQWRYLQEWERF